MQAVCTAFYSNIRAIWQTIKEDVVDVKGQFSGPDGDFYFAVSLKSST